MKALLYPAGLTLLVALLCPSCEQRTEITIESTAEEPSGTTEAATSPQRSPLDREPIPNTTPPGSSMDPTSNAYIIFDGSGSMAGGPIDEAKRAISAFVADAPADLNIGLFVFDNNSNGREMVALGKGDAHRSELATKIASIRAGGGTPLGNAIHVGTTSLIKQFQKQLRYGDVRLIVVTDGMASNEQNFRQGISFARAHHVPIYTIGFRIRNDHPLRQYSEAYFRASDEQELLGAMKETLAELDDDATDF